MVIDTSAVIAILQGEPEGRAFSDLISASVNRLIPAANAVEASIIVLSRQGEPGLAILRELLARMQIETVPLASGHVELAIDAFRRYGRGRHRAALNFGDCFAYALAKATDEPLLFKGQDFPYTDIRPAVV